jgi:hypothetical protein
VKTLTFRILTLILMLLGLVACGSARPVATSSSVEVGTAVAGTLTAVAPSPLPPTSTGTPVPSPIYWACFTCGGDQVWLLGSGEPRLFRLPHAMGQYYGYSPQSNQILMAEAFADHGAGPGNVAVSDLSLMDVDSGQITQLLPADVVEAAWAPDGRALAYISATPTTYELHWRAAEGQDVVLASDVSFTWSIAPSGQQVAFTRESGYGLASSPGLFVVNVSDGKILQVSDANKAGTGGLGDAPIWSPDSQRLLLSLWGSPQSRLIFARADGSLTFDVGPDPGNAGAWWSGTQIQGALWYPDGEHLLVNSTDSNGALGGPTALVNYRLDLGSKALAEGQLLGQIDGLIGWEIPGRSYWVMGGGGQVARYVLSGD